MPENKMFFANRSRAKEKPAVKKSPRACFVSRLGSREGRCYFFFFAAAFFAGFFAGAFFAFVAFAIAITPFRLGWMS
jgi:hypothetical protein